MIDLHAHVVLEGTLGSAGEYGPELVDDPQCPTFRVGGYTLEGVRYRGSPFMDLDARLRAMDEMGIEVQMLSPNPLTYLHHVEVPVAVDFARRHNDEMASLVALDPTRLVGAAQLPMQDPDSAVRELVRSVEELGLVAAYVGTDFGVPSEGLALDSREFDPLWSTAADLSVPVFVHPAPPGTDGPLRDERIRRFDAELWLSFAYEETLAVASLVFGGVLDRHPDLDVCISHGGGALVALLPKLRRIARTRAWVPDHLRPPGALEDRLRMLWYDAHVGDATVLAALEGIVGADRAVGGTNFAGWDQPGSLPAAETCSRLDANARRLLGLPQR